MKHLAALRRLAGVAPIAIPKRRERAAALREAGFATAADLAGAVDMGATLCVVASEPGQHLRDGASASDHGMDVLVEKPLATDAEVADRLCRGARRQGRAVFVGCVLRFSESLGTFRARLGAIGRVHTVRIECQSYLPAWRLERPYRQSYSARAAEGGVMRDLIHEIDYAAWLFGWPTTLQAKAKNLGRLGIETEETADLMWETGDGGVVTVHLDYLSRPPRRLLRASGEFGTLEWNGLDGSGTLALAETPAEVTRSRETLEDMFRAQAWAFVSAAGGARDARLATGEEGVRALAVCAAAWRAAESGRDEPVTYP